MSTKAFLQKSVTLFALIFFTAVGYYLLCYQTVRDHSIVVIGLFSMLFVGYFLCFKYFSKNYFLSLIAAGILFRILLILSIPNLSDDVYRFIWDGRLSANGINPFSYLPAEIINQEPIDGITEQLYKKLNSPGYFTIYPPVLQSIFWAAGKLFPTSVYAAIIFFKVIIFLFDVGNVYLLLQLLKTRRLPRELSLLYFLNPLVITELTGNVHFESVMIFFTLLAFLLLFYNKKKTSALCMGLGIATKLMPILFVPLIVRLVGWKQSLVYIAIVAITTLILFAVMFDAATIQNLFRSVDLFLQKFEFNASIYYVIRWLGAVLVGFNVIEHAGPILSIIAAVLILMLSLINKESTNEQVFTKAIFIISIWFLFATTVHPWYICLPLALGVLTHYRYVFWWSFTATLSYSAYNYTPVKENLWLVGAGYVFIIVYAMIELKKNAPLKLR